MFTSTYRSCVFLNETLYRWSKTVDWANQFIVDHATAQKQVGKPVIMEEYGWMSAAARLQNLGTVSNFTRVEVEGGWQNIVVQTYHGGDLRALDAVHWYGMVLLVIAGIDKH